MNILNNTVSDNKIFKNWITESKSESFSGLDLTYTLQDSIIPGLKTELFLHQRTIVKAMIDIENKRNHTINNFKVRTNAAILSEPVGSGKTIDILSLILLQDTPKLLRGMVELSTGLNRYAKISPLSNIIFKKIKNILKPTLILVGVSVLLQWEKSISNFTDLKFFTVGNVKQLDELFNMIHTKQINKYDIILVKNGKITRTPKNIPDNIKLNECNLNKSTYYIYNFISNLYHVTWNRVVIDDFDTIHLDGGFYLINSIFTWYISSTKKKLKFSHIMDESYENTEQFLISHRNLLNSIQNNKCLQLFNIYNNKQFYNQSIFLPKPNFFQYLLINKNDKYINAIGSLNQSDAKEIMEMLNADSIESAADRAGITATSVIDMFEKILSKKYESLKEAYTILNFIKEQQQNNNKRQFVENETYTLKDLRQLIPIDYKYPNIDKLLKEWYQKYIDIRDNDLLEINRIKSNLDVAECPICVDDLNESDIIIYKCCDVILCPLCSFGGIFNKQTLKGICSNCRSNINITDIIYMKNVNNSLDNLLEELEDDNINKNINLIEEKEELKNELENRTKIHVIIDIINNIVPIEQKTINIKIENIMYGTTDFNINSQIKKILIFSNYDETFKILMKKLNKLKIKYIKLGGTYKQINNNVDIFNNSGELIVMLVNSIKHCNGLNLQTCTDIIFTHKILDKNIESQVCGRGQRIGRKTKLNIHYILYQNEKKYM